MSLLLLRRVAPIAPPQLVLPIDRREAANYQSRHSYGVAGIVEHIGVAPTFNSLWSYLRSANDRQVSATFVIGGDYVGQWALLVGSGLDLALAKELLARAANHAGIETWPNTNPKPGPNPNWWTIGKEHVGYPGQIWSDIMIQNDIACNNYIRAMLGNAPFQHVLAHHNFDPVDRANCPGPTFPWSVIYSVAEIPKIPRTVVRIPEIPREELEKLPIGDHQAYRKLAREYQ